MRKTYISGDGFFTASLEQYGVQEYVYTGERVIMELVNDDEQQIDFVVNGVTYHSDADGRLVVDMTDEARIALNDGTAILSVEVTMDSDELTLSLDLHDGLPPEKLLLPPPAVGADGVSVQIVPPSVIYAHPLYSYRYPMLVQVYGANEIVTWYTRYNDSTTFNSRTVSAGQLTLPNINEAGDVPHRAWTAEFKTSVLRYVVTTLDRCESVCLLRWTSASGVVKQALWKMKKVQKEATTVELLAMGNEYKQQRGQDISFVAYIEGCDVYSAAYYADIITSPKVYCVTDPNTNVTDITNDNNLVAVGTDSYMQADGDVGETMTVEVTIKYKHYDAL